MDNSTIKNLFVELSQDKVEAYDAIFRNFYAPLVLFSNSFVGDRNSAEDIVSNVFCKLWIDRKKYKDVLYGKTYLFNSVKNSSIDFIRKNKKTTIQSLDENLKIEVDECDIFEVELYTKLNNIISTLPTKCSDILKMKLDGMSDREISDQIGVKFETVRSHQKRGFILMRDKFNRSYTLFLFIPYL